MMEPPLYFARAFTPERGMPNRVVRLAAAVHYGTRKAGPGIRDVQLWRRGKADDYKSFISVRRIRKANMGATFRARLGFTSWESHRVFCVAGTPV